MAPAASNVDDEILNLFGVSSLPRNEFRIKAKALRVRSQPFSLVNRARWRAHADDATVLEHVHFSRLPFQAPKKDARPIALLRSAGASFDSATATTISSNLPKTRLETTDLDSERGVEEPNGQHLAMDEMEPQTVGGIGNLFLDGYVELDGAQLGSFQVELPLADPSPSKHAFLDIWVPLTIDAQSPPAGELRLQIYFVETEKRKQTALLVDATFPFTETQPKTLKTEAPVDATKESEAVVPKLFQTSLACYPQVLLNSPDDEYRFQVVCGDQRLTSSWTANPSSWSERPIEFFELGDGVATVEFALFCRRRGLGSASDDENAVEDWSAMETDHPLRPLMYMFGEDERQSIVEHSQLVDRAVVSLRNPSAAAPFEDNRSPPAGPPSLSRQPSALGVLTRSPSWNALPNAADDDASAAAETVDSAHPISTTESSQGFPEASPASRSRLKRRPSSVSARATGQALSVSALSKSGRFVAHVKKGETRASPASVVGFQLSVNLEGGFGLNLAHSPTQDLAFVSLTGINLYYARYLTDRIVVDASLAAFQVDDLGDSPRFPVVLSPAPLMDVEDEDEGSESDPTLDLPRDVSEYLSERSRAQPSGSESSCATFTLIVDAPQRTVQLVETFLQETNVKLDESFLIRLQSFALELDREKRLDAREANPALLDHAAVPPAAAEDPLASFDAEARRADELDAEGDATSEFSILRPRARSEEEKEEEGAPSPDATTSVYMFERVDLRPVRFNLTLNLSSGGESLMAISRRFPWINVLVGAVATLSDAPIRLAAIRAFSQARTIPSLTTDVSKHFSQQVQRQLLLIAGSTDLLGSPVNLMNSFSKGAFSFFYEPALALSTGYSNVGRGLRRGGTRLVRLAAGGALESISKFFRTVSTTIVRLKSMDPTFQKKWYKALSEIQSGPAEPVNAGESLLSGAQVLTFAVVQGLISLVAGPVKGYRRGGVRSVPAGTLNGLISALLLPSMGISDALGILSVGVRNSIVASGATPFPLRISRGGGGARGTPSGGALSKSLEPKADAGLTRPMDAYSSRAAVGRSMVEARFRGASAYATHEWVLIEEREEEEEKSGAVAVLLVTDRWIVAARRVPGKPDFWTIPIAEIRDAWTGAEGRDWVVETAAARRTRVRCLDAARVEALARAVAASPEWRAGTPLRVREDLPPLREAWSPARETQLRVLHLTIRDAVITSYGDASDAVRYYRVSMLGACPSTGEDGGGSAGVLSGSAPPKLFQWTVLRRYSEFLRFRDDICTFLGTPRKSLPLPSKRPWSLTYAEATERWRGLQKALDRVVSVDLLRESLVLKEFCSKGAFGLQEMDEESAAALL